jgi:hypothetical protein
VTGIWRLRPPRVIVGTVRRRWFKPLVYVLVAAQLLLAAPIVSAAAKATAMPCGDSMTMPGSASHDCGCCPGDVTSMGDCMSACTAVQAPPPAIAVVASAITFTDASAPPVVAVTEFGDPPLKPPPIR